jgi:peptidoglycan hydrolase FlgJ
MAISPASDIILDVARAADPQKAVIATRALAATAGDANPDFAGALGNPRGVAPHDFSYRNPSDSSRSVSPSPMTPERKAAIGLEGLLLKNFIDQMLPRDATEVFGSGVAGDVWRSMLSEKIADQIAKSGALKIGDRLFASHSNLLQSHRGAIHEKP